MKKILLKYISYLLFVSLTFTACVNEMNVIESEQDLDGNSGQSYLLNPLIKFIVEYDESIDKYDIKKFESALDVLVRHLPQIEELINLMVRDDIKVRVQMSSNPSQGPDAEYQPGRPPKISFRLSSCITMENVLHEFIHHFTFNAYEVYRNGLYPACEEYEVRVLTDLLLRKIHGKDASFEYKGIKSNAGVMYVAYKKWIEELIQNPNCNIDNFIMEFKKYGVYCIINLGKPNKPNVPELKPDDLDSYVPRLMWDFWLNYGK